MREKLNKNSIRYGYGFRKIKEYMQDGELYCIQGYCKLVVVIDSG
jgi:hypothetical protein